MKKKWTKDDILSVLESLLLAGGRPVKMAEILSCMGEGFKPHEIKEHLKALAKTYQKKDRGMKLREAAGGWQLITKDENREYVQYLKKTRPFRLSKASLEVLSIIAYKQPCTRAEIGQMRRADSGHILRTLMDRGLVQFAGASDQPGKPMTYKTTARFLEVYGLKNLKGLPSLDEIKDEFSPENTSVFEDEAESSSPRTLNFKP